MTTTSIINYLDRALSPVGFQRKKATWNRESGQFVDVLDIQISKAKSSVTLNIGVMERDVYAATWGANPNRLWKRRIARFTLESVNCLMARTSGGLCRMQMLLK